MDKVKAFEKELVYIKNPNIRKFAEKAIEDLPDYFFSIPASSTGKYHPVYSLGDGGLLRHCRAAMRIAVELFRLDMFRHFSDDEKDLILVALAIHDGRKSGNIQTRFTAEDHPILQANSMRENEELRSMISEEYFALVCDSVSSHMGQWSTNRAGAEILPKPKSKIQNFVHLIDYLGSRRCLEMNFDVELSR